MPPSGVTPWDRPEILRIWLAGRWRIAYEVDDEARRVLILRLRRKESIDFDTLPSWMHDSGDIQIPVVEISSSSQRSRDRSRLMTRTRTASPTV